MEGNDPIRVMLVDDSAVVRRLVAASLRETPDLSVVGMAVNGQEALEQLDLFRPHVVVLDVEMPVLDGLSTLRRLRQRWPGLPVVMFSTLTRHGAEATLDALAAGANDYVTKPTNGGSLDGALDLLRDGLVPVVRAWGAIGRRRAAAGSRATGTGTGASAPAGPAPTPPAVPLRARPAVRLPVEALVIGSSTGGPNALGELIPRLPADLPVPVLVVQHMPETFTRLLADRLDEKSPLHVSESEPGARLEPGRVLIARGGTHLLVRKAGAALVAEHGDGPPEHSCRPAVDVLFRSAVDTWGGGVLGVVLTGMGVDGLAGAASITSAGGEVLTQDEASSVVWGMPGAVATAGLSSANLPLDRLAPAILDRIHLLTRAGRP